MEDQNEPVQDDRKEERKSYLSDLGVPLALSATQMDMFQRCGYQYYRRYVLGEKSPPSAALAFGRADDETKNAVYGQKLITPDETTPVGECQDLFRDLWQREAENVEDWGRDDPGKLQDTGINLISQWRDQRAVLTTPISVQHNFEVDLWNTDPELINMAEAEPALAEQMPQPFLVTGVLDVVVDTAVRKFVRDHKTAGKKKSDREIAAETQPALYSLASTIDPVLHGVDPDYFEFEFAIKTKVPYLLEQPRKVDAPERAGMVKRLMRTRRGIDESVKSGTFLPNRKSMMCSKRWCGWWRECVKEFGGEVPE